MKGGNAEAARVEREIKSWVSSHDSAETEIHNSYESQNHDHTIFRGLHTWDENLFYLQLHWLNNIGINGKISINDSNLKVFSDYNGIL